MALRDLLDNDDDRRELRDFSDRYHRGRVEEGYDEDEARRRYSHIDRHIDDDDYRESAREAFSRMDRPQRQEYGRELRRRGRERGFDVGRDDDDDDPDVLASVLGGMRQRDRGGLDGLLGGGDGGGLLGGSMGKVLMGGIAAIAAQKVLGQR